MRIARVITRLDVHGGAELSTLIELEELAARGHDAIVVTLSEPATLAATERLDAAGVQHRHLDGNLAGQVVELGRLIRSWAPDVVHAVIFRAEVVTALAAVRSGVPTIVSLVNTQYDQAAVAQAPSPRRLEVMRRVESVVLGRGIDRFHCLTQAGQRHSTERLGISPERITVIPRGRRRVSLEADPEHVARVRADLAVPEQALLVSVGRHELQKGQDLLLAAAGALRSGGVRFRVAIAGREGRRTAMLRELIESQGLSESVVLLGARPDVPALLRAADVVCVTSRWEGLGGSIIEALGSGAAIVAFGVPAVSEVVGDAGLLVEPFDVEAFAGSVRSLVEDDERRSELSDLALARFDERFELEPVMDLIEEMYRSSV